MSAAEDFPVGAVVRRPSGYVLGTVSRHEGWGGIRVDSLNGGGGQAIWQPYELELADADDTPTLW